MPRGGYEMESILYEGTLIAESFVHKGIAAFVLKYRLPNDSTMLNKSIGPLQDAQQAIKIVRENAKQWKIDTSKIGIIGFSAGGHLAATSGTHFDKDYISNEETTNLRPSFMILIYPIISMKKEITHYQSSVNLLGNSPKEEEIIFFSNEMNVTTKTPPTWILHSGVDNVVSVQNSIRFYQELIKNKVPTEMHLLPYGEHGFILNLSTDEWMKPMFDWIFKYISK